MTPEETILLRTLAGYRNRLVHFYHEVGVEELYDVAVNHLQDVEQLLEAYRRWLQTNPQKLDTAL